MCKNTSATFAKIFSHKHTAAVEDGRTDGRMDGSDRIEGGTCTGRNVLILLPGNRTELDGRNSIGLADSFELHRRGVLALLPRGIFVLPVQYD